MNDLQLISQEELLLVEGGCTICKVGETMMATGFFILAPTPFTAANLIGAVVSLITIWS